MNETGQGHRTLGSETIASVAMNDDDALEYWIAKAEWLNTAKLRTLADHFRRDTPSGVVTPFRAR